jgi:hypothetical protein
MVNQIASPLLYGYFAGSKNAGVSDFVLSSTSWFAWGFMVNEAKTLKNCIVNSTATNAPGVICELRTDDAYLQKPSASVLATATASSSNTTPPWNTFLGFNYVLTPGIQYWITFRNSGMSCKCWTVMLSVYGDISVQGSGCGEGWFRATTSTSGSSWTTYGSQTGLLLQFSDDTYTGFPIEYCYLDLLKVYGAIEKGVKFKTPQNAALIVRGISLPCYKYGSPPNLPVYKLYQNDVLLGTTGNPIGNYGTSATAIYWIEGYFATPITLAADTWTKITMATSNGDASNYYCMQYLVLQDTAASIALKPNRGTLVRTTFDSVWTDGPSCEFSPYCLLLQIEDIYSGGGIVIPQLYYHYQQKRRKR